MLPTTTRLAALAVAATATGSIGATVDVEFRLLTPEPVIVGDEVAVGLFLTSSEPGVHQPISAVEIVFEWEVASLDFVGIDGAGGAPVGFQGFILNGSSGLNESDPPQDGDGLYYALAMFGTPIVAAPSGTLLTTFVFQTTAIDPDAGVLLPETAGNPPRRTIVFDGVIPNTDITGARASLVFPIRSDCGPADCDHNGILNVDDIDCFAAGFLSGDLGVADCDGSGLLNVDDVDCFATAFLAGCP